MKDKMEIIYDYGDNWIFEMVVSKISDYDVENNFEVISGKGYGIIEDCGGVWGLGDIYNGEDDSWGEYDIDEFDLDECNQNAKKRIY